MTSEATCGTISGLDLTKLNSEFFTLAFPRSRLSPTLFGIFVADLVLELRAKSPHLLCTSPTKPTYFMMESGEIFISRFLTSGIEPEARGSIRRYLTTRPERHQDLMSLWPSGQILTYRTSRLGFDSRSQKSGDEYFSGFHQHLESLRTKFRFGRVVRSLHIEPRASGSIPEVSNLEINISPDSVTLGSTTQIWIGGPVC